MAWSLARSCSRLCLLVERGLYAIVYSPICTSRLAGVALARATAIACLLRNLTLCALVLLLGRLYVLFMPGERTKAGL
ncbi:hypothetical protein FHX51_000746 [Aeriscardovia aeriphila]|uniref:Uncharacterized protein n=1 Tax=Aeriscardovia aeriphila TaxID=218139 RepID=A0A261FA95_9BIFI|nr:hypothetical protein [Aeriscardovia aeriphila]OZG56052.1 hypothetical protein AEAE_0540 [Aeriscardovia aeriphila]